MSKIKSRLTYANAMSSIAVFLILGGATAVAAKKHTQKIGTTQIKASAVTTAKLKNAAVDATKLKDAAVTNAKIADGSVTTAKIADGSVTTEKIANDSVTGDKVRESTLTEVPSANSANPSVFARVNANGTVDAGNSKGLTSPNVSKAATGIYCITPASFTPRGGQVSAERSAGLVTAANLTIGGGPSCPAPKLQVETFVSSAAADLPFYVELYR